MPVATDVIFEELGFEPFEDELSSAPAFRTSLGPWEVRATLLTNRWLRESWMLGGIVNTGRTLSMIEGELPLEVESREQGLALLSYFLARHIPETAKAPWLRIGERMGSHLPWARDREEKTMDLHKQIAKDVRSKKERDAAAQFLKRLYSSAIKGTEWEELRDELDREADPIDADDPLELYEVEDRGVGVIWPEEGMGHAWVWSNGWRYAPGLVNKSWLEGNRLSRGAFARDFPTADLAGLEVLASEALKRPPEQTR